MQSTEDVQGTQPVMESESAGEETQNLLNYLVVDKPYIEQGDIQSIVASVGDENTVVNQQRLLITGSLMERHIRLTCLNIKIMQCYLRYPLKRVRRQESIF